MQAGIIRSARLVRSSTASAVKPLISFVSGLDNGLAPFNIVFGKIPVHQIGGQPRVLFDP